MDLTPQTRQFLLLALQEDLAHGDITTMGMPQRRACAEIRVNQGAVISGIPAAAEVFRLVNETLTFHALVREGSKVKPGDTIIVVEGPAASLLAGERLALNLLMRLSGVATLAAEFVAAIQGTGVMLLETRKTTPGLRDLEKAAARAGGFHNHRFSLDSGVLIKDNHLNLAGGVTQAVDTARRVAPPALRIEVEVTTVVQAREAVDAGADALLLDNMDPETVKTVCDELKDRVFLEVSGNITLENIRDFALAGPHAISTSAIFKYSRWVDMSLNMRVTK